MLFGSFSVSGRLHGRLILRVIMKVSELLEIRSSPSENHCSEAPSTKMFIPGHEGINGEGIAKGNSENAKECQRL